MSFYGLPRKHVPSIYHVVLLRNPERAPCIRNHAFALVAALDWTEYEGLAGGVHLVAGQGMPVVDEIFEEMLDMME